jgi:hypothetical protein
MVPFADVKRRCEPQADHIPSAFPRSLRFYFAQRVAECREGGLQAIGAHSVHMNIIRPSVKLASRESGSVRFSIRERRYPMGATRARIWRT